MTARRPLPSAVELIRTDASRYRVTLRGVEIGTVQRSTRTWERRAPGCRYVLARGERPCWRASGDARTFDTRRDAVLALVDRRVDRSG